MIRIISLFFLSSVLLSCGYPDIDNVPDFKDLQLSNEEIDDYCKNFYIDTKDIDKCIIDNKDR